ncbi:8961_t:CDS:2 [Gigaspora margarita]|uniref:8961_t:CDS:1 n=1 Tax=Gigaspora margarita TaxID=4874 RepID=A0ABN7UXV1_GIGMA|nr:8961_t:CDS:2 [Gigaspora margarita]
MRHQVKNNYSSQRIGRIETLMCKGKPVALKERLYYIIAEEHLTIGHEGTRNTYTEVSDKYHGIKRCLVDRFVEKCKTCKSRRKSIKPLAIKPIINIRTRKDGEFKWIAHVRDHFSHFFWAHVLTDKYAAKMLLTILQNFGQILKSFMESHRDHKTQGSVKKTVGLAMIVYSMNLFVCYATNKRPFELVFGHKPHGHCVFIDQLWSQEIRYEEKIPNDVQIEDNIQSNDDEIASKLNITIMNLMKI